MQVSIVKLHSRSSALRYLAGFKVEQCQRVNRFGATFRMVRLILRAT